MNIWLVMLLGGLITFAMRFSLIYLFGRFEVPPTLRQALHSAHVAERVAGKRERVGDVKNAQLRLLRRGPEPG